LARQGRTRRDARISAYAVLELVSPPATSITRKGRRANGRTFPVRRALRPGVPRMRQGLRGDQPAQPLPGMWLRGCRAVERL